MPVPDFSPGEVLTAAAMDSIGLWLVKTQTVGAGVTSVSVTNAFSADYNNYRVIYSGGTAAGAASMNFSLTGSSASYYLAVTGAAYTGGASSISEANVSVWSFAGIATINGCSLDVTVYNPFLSLRTGLQVTGRVDMRTDGAAFVGSGFHNVSSSYTGFTIAASQAMTGGTIRVYGYRN